MPCLIHIFAKSAFERRLKFQTWLRYQCKSDINFRSKLRTGWWIGFMSSLLLTSTGPRLDSKLSFVFTGLIIWITADSYGTSGFWSVSYRDFCRSRKRQSFIRINFMTLFLNYEGGFIFSTTLRNRAAHRLSAALRERCNSASEQDLKKRGECYTCTPPHKTGFKTHIFIFHSGHLGHSPTTLLRSVVLKMNPPS